MIGIPDPRSHGRPGDPNPSQPVVRPEERRRPWLPACLSVHGLGLDDLGRFSYLVVEEIVEDVVGVTISPWPAADGIGRLRFDAGEAPEVGIGVAQLHEEVYDGWLDRLPRIGDVFGGPVDRSRLAGATTVVWSGPLAELLPGPLYDLTQEARLVAKLAMYAVRSDILPMARAEAYGMGDQAVRDRHWALVRERPGRAGEEL